MKPETLKGKMWYVKEWSSNPYKDDAEHMHGFMKDDVLSAVEWLKREIIKTTIEKGVISKYEVFQNGYNKGISQCLVLIDVAFGK